MEALFDPKWFALQDFHGQWFEDSDALEDLLHFRRQTFDDFGVYFRRHAPILAALQVSMPAFAFRLAHSSPPSRISKARPRPTRAGSRPPAPPPATAAKPASILPSTALSRLAERMLVARANADRE